MPKVADPQPLELPSSVPVTDDPADFRTTLKFGLTMGMAVGLAADANTALEGLIAPSVARAPIVTIRCLVSITLSPCMEGARYVAASIFQSKKPVGHEC